jgi:hypothetical protein
MPLVGRIVVAFGVVAAVMALSAPAWAVLAGEFCSDSAAAAGLTLVADNGVTVKCQGDSAGHRRWTAVAAAVISPTTQPGVTTTAVTSNPTASATTSSGLAGTGLRHTAQFVELALVFLGLGLGIALEVQARDGLDRLRRRK